MAVRSSSSRRFIAFGSISLILGVIAVGALVAMSGFGTPLTGRSPSQTRSSARPVLLPLKSSQSPRGRTGHHPDPTAAKTSSVHAEKLLGVRLLLKGLRAHYKKLITVAVVIVVIVAAVLLVSAIQSQIAAAEAKKTESPPPPKTVPDPSRKPFGGDPLVILVSVAAVLAVGTAIVIGLVAYNARTKRADRIFYGREPSQRLERREWDALFAADGALGGGHDQIKQVKKLIMSRRIPNHLFKDIWLRLLDIRDWNMKNEGFEKSKAESKEDYAKCARELSLRKRDPKVCEAIDDAVRKSGVKSTESLERILHVYMSSGEFAEFLPEYGQFAATAMLVFSEDGSISESEEIIAFMILDGLIRERNYIFEHSSAAKMRELTLTTLNERADTQDLHRVAEDPACGLEAIFNNWLWASFYGDSNPGGDRLSDHLNIWTCFLCSDDLSRTMTGIVVTMLKQRASHILESADKPKALRDVLTKDTNWDWEQLRNECVVHEDSASDLIR